MSSLLRHIKLTVLLIKVLQLIMRYLFSLASCHLTHSSLSPGTRAACVKIYNSFILSKVFIIAICLLIDSVFVLIIKKALPLPIELEFLSACGLTFGFRLRQECVLSVFPAVSRSSVFSSLHYFFQPTLLFSLLFPSGTSFLPTAAFSSLRFLPRSFRPRFAFSCSA